MGLYDTTLEKNTRIPDAAEKDADGNQYQGFCLPGTEDTASETWLIVKFELTANGGYLRKFPGGNENAYNQAWDNWNTDLNWKFRR